MFREMCIGCDVELVCLEKCVSVVIGCDGVSVFREMCIGCDVELVCLEKCVSVVIWS